MLLNIRDYDFQSHHCDKFFSNTFTSKDHSHILNSQGQDREGAKWGIGGRGWLFFRIPQQFLEDQGACAFQRCRGSPARLGTQRKPGELIIAWEESRAHYKAVSLDSGPREAGTQNDSISPHGFYNATLLPGHREAELQRGVLGRKGRQGVPGSQLCWRLEVPERQQTKRAHACGADRVAAGAVAFHPCQDNKRLPTSPPAVRRFSPCIRTSLGAELPWLGHFSELPGPEAPAGCTCDPGVADVVHPGLQMG